MKHLATILAIFMASHSTGLVPAFAGVPGANIQEKSDKQPDAQFAKPGARRSAPRPPKEVTAHAQKQRPVLPLEYIDSVNTPTNDFVWSRYGYKTKEAANGWPSGVIHVLWHLDSSTPVWSLDWGGDFQPHSPAWIDFDGDGRRDLFFFAGEEDVFATHIYLWRLKALSFSKEALIKVYSNDNDYSVLLDFERDGRPEILDSGYPGSDHVENYCGGDPENDHPQIPDIVKKELEEKYHTLSLGFDQFNFNYGMPEVYPFLSMKIFDPIKILRIEGSSVIDVTARYPGHLRWRLDMLKQIRAVNSGTCLVLIDSVTSYLKRRLTDKRPLQPDRASPDSTRERRR